MRRSQVKLECLAVIGSGCRWSTWGAAITVGFSCFVLQNRVRRRSWPARPLCFLVSTWLATHPSGLSTFLPAESPTGSTLGVSSRIAGTMPSDPIISSQAHLLKATSDNPLPTAVPPPIAATSGTLGVRHVLCLIGLPERGKPFIARRLQSYLSFFHGADVQLFNINDYSDYPTGVQRVGQLTLRPWPQISL